jgi:chorismate synthase
MDSQKNSDTTDNPFHPSLVYQILQSGLDDGSGGKMSARITEEALVAAGEVLRLFVQEAWHRASIEAECDHEGTMSGNEEQHELNSSSAVQKGSNVPIQPYHITKIAAELLMDFS